MGPPVSAGGAGAWVFLTSWARPCYTQGVQEGRATALQGEERREASCTVGGKVNWCSHCGEQYGGS